MKNSIPKVLAFTSLWMINFSCKNQSAIEQSGNFSANPFATESKLALHAPDFSRIKDEDFKPAMEEGMKQQQEEIKKIAENPEAPSFENTLVALEKSGQLLTRVGLVFNLLTGANTNPLLQKVQDEEAPKLAANDDALYLNSKLFARVQTLYQQKEQLKLDPESKRLLEYYYQKFELAGARLSEAAKDTLRKLNQEEALLGSQFTNQLLAATKNGSVVLNSVEELKGLSDGEIAAAVQSAKDNKLEGKWMISLQNTTQQPSLLSLSNRATRQKILEASLNRAEKSDSNDTRKTIVRIAEIRAIKAKLLGFTNYADWKLRDQMAQTPEAVNTFLAKLVPAAAAKVKTESGEIQALINQQKGGFDVEAWDWNYYSDQVRKAKYDLDESAIKPYFLLDSVLKNGVFYAANLLYGLSFKERKDLPVYQSDVRVFDVMDKDGSQIALFYCDYFKRDNKSGGAWMSNMVNQSHLLGTKPVIYNVCNFSKPVAGQPALITFSDVTTMFHEFGHGLHGIFADQQYPSISGSNTARDFVEFPSQFNEHWAMDPKVFANYAKHYQTGAAMPQLLVEKIKKAGTFNKGYTTTEALSATLLDLQWHILSPENINHDVDQFEMAALQKSGLYLKQVPPRYRSSYFLHIWGNGYAASYYAYIWTAMLSEDAFAWFKEHGGLTRENGQRFRDMVLSRGNTLEYGKMYRAFRGHDPEIQPLLESRGLTGK